MDIGGLQKNSFIDYPGRVAAVVFTQGCDWRCPFCHNASLVVPRFYGPLIPVEDVMRFLRDRRGKLDGVVVSGGEPTLQSDLPEFLAEIKALGFEVKLDTHGGRPEVLRELLKQNLLDYVAMNIKAPLAGYNAATGARPDTEAIRSSIWIVKNSGIDYEFRTTAIPGIHTYQEMKEIGSLVHGAKRYVVQAFRSEHTLNPHLNGRRGFEPMFYEQLRRHFQGRVESFELRTTTEAEVQATH